MQKNESTKAAVASQITLLIRGMYSNPPAFGSRIVNLVLNDATLRGEWMECIKTMSSRIIAMRKALYDELVALKTPGTWEHITQQIGMFSYTGLNGKSNCWFSKSAWFHHTTSSNPTQRNKWRF